MAKQHPKGCIDLTEESALRKSDPIYVKPGSRIRELIRAVLYWQELHWMDSFLIFPTWLKKTQGSNYLDMFESVAAKVHEELGNGIKLERRKNTKLWRLEFPHKNRPTFSIDKTIGLLEKSRNLLSEKNLSGWDLMIEVCKGDVNPRNIWQALIYANELPKKGLMQKPEFCNIKKRLKEYQKTLVRAIIIASRKASSGIQGLSFQNSSEALARWIVEIVNINNVLDLFSGITIPEPEQKNPEIVSLVRLLNSLKESTGEDAGDVHVEMKEAMDQEVSALLEKLCKHPIVQNAVEKALSYIELLSYPNAKPDNDKKWLRDAMCDYILGMHGPIRPHTFYEGQFYKDIRIFAENYNTGKHVLNDICNSPDLPPEEKEKAILALLKEIVQEEELTTGVVEEIAGILKGVGQGIKPNEALETLKLQNLWIEPKHLQLFKDVLGLENKVSSKETPMWFRPTGPLAVDFEKGYVYERKELLDELYELVHNNSISILEGESATGKSVVARSLVLCKN